MNNIFNLKSISKYFKSSSFKFGEDFKRDWIAVVFFSFIVFIILLSVAFWLDLYLIKKQKEITNTHRTVISLNRETLSDVVSFYKDQAKTFEDAKKESVKYKDPSH